MTNCIKYKMTLKSELTINDLRNVKYIIFILKNVAAQTGDTRSPSNVEVGTLQWIFLVQLRQGACVCMRGCMCVHACLYCYHDGRSDLCNTFLLTYYLQINTTC